MTVFSMLKELMKQKMIGDFEWSERTNGTLNFSGKSQVFAPEIVLVKGGAFMDVIGAFSHRVPAGEFRKVHALHPRTEFKKIMVDSIKVFPHARHSHAHFVCQCGFEHFAAHNALDQEQFQ